MSHDRQVNTVPTNVYEHKYVNVNGNASAHGTPNSDGYYYNAQPGAGLYRGPAQAPAPIINPLNLNDNYSASRLQNDGGINYQRTPFIQPGQQVTPPKGIPRPSGLPDEATDGPSRPEHRWIERSHRTEAGTQSTQNLDNRVVPRSPYGRQDGVSYIQRQDPILGNPAFSAPVYDANGVQQGSAQRIAPAGPHGLHTRTIIPTEKSLANRVKQPQQKGTPQNRLANSGRAGQTFSQQTQHVPGTPGASQPGYSQRGVPRGR